jgi:type IV secretory pathway VirB3-like protein
MAATELEKSKVTTALLKRPLSMGVPRWFLSLEALLIFVPIYALKIHPATFLSVIVVAFVVHPFAAMQCRKDPYAIEILVGYLRRPIVYSGRTLLRARSLRPWRSYRKG